MHLKNKHKENYNLEELSTILPSLKEFVFINKFGTTTIDFSNSKAVKLLNTALLKKHYQISYWEFTDKNLCPPIPSRVDYIHHLADLISTNSKQVTVLDIGTGATCIYPLLGHTTYKWNFVATDIDSSSIKNAQEIITRNQLENVIELRLQPNKNHILKDIVQPNDYFNISMCNPPFYKSEYEAIKANTRKNTNLKLKNVRNFSGNANELWYKGGEKAFLNNYIYESANYKKQFDWFSSLVSKKDLIKDLKRNLKKLKASNIKVIEMEQGSKISRILAWQFE